MSNFVTETEESLRKKRNSNTAKTLKIIKPHIIERWEQAARELVPAASKKDPLVLKDELDLFLDELADALTPGTLIYDSTGFSESSKEHGQHRAATEGYSIDQMLQEYSLLRKTIIWSLVEAGDLLETEREIISDSVDRAMQDAAQNYFEAQQSQLKVALLRAENSNQELEHFAAIAAHDLKSPLNSITGFLELILEEFKDVAGPDVKEMFSFIADASDRMRNLVDRLLAYASLRSSTPDFIDVALNDVANSAIANLKIYIEERTAIVAHTELPVIHGDLVLLIQLFQNIISNGLKYNDQVQPSVHIDFVNFEDFYRISFKDNGIGIRQEDKDAIFKPYKRLHSKRDYQGAGLGLATCYRIMEIHQGRIHLISTPEQGTTFHLDFPKIRLQETKHRHLHS